jgi:hypothetical protein
MYTRIVLTVIAACLVWLCAFTAGWPLQAQPRTPPLAAERAQPVVVVGWGTLDTEGRITLTMNPDRSKSSTDPTLPVKVVDYPMPPAPVDVRLEYSEAHPLPTAISGIKRTGAWDAVRTVVEPEGTRPRPGGR